MTVTAIRKKLISYFKEASDKKVRAVYEVLEKDIESEEDIILTNTQIKELNRRRANHKKGISKSYTWNEVKAKLILPL